MLPRCLAAVAPAVDEIVIVDTGSTDATVEIAKSFGAKVIDFPWTGSFSEARNVSFEAATGDWVMYLDADEVLVAEDVEQLRALTGRTWREAFYLVETSYTGELGDGGAMVNNALRVFRNRPEYRFKDRLHEQIAHTLPTYIPGRVEQTPVRVTHYGYLGSVRDAKEKSQRNIELLRKQAAESPKTPFLHFNLGSEYIVVGNLERRDRGAQDRPLAGDGRGQPPARRVRAVAVHAPGHGAAHVRQADRGQHRRRGGPGAVPAVHRPRPGAGPHRPDGGRHRQAVALFHSAIEMGDAPARYGPMMGSGTFLARLALAELHLELGEAAAGAYRASVVRREPPRLPRGRRPVRVGAAARRRRPRRGGRRAGEARHAARRHPPDGGH